MNSGASFDKQPLLALVAGEASGDLLASGLLAHLNQSGLHYAAEGIAGPRMTGEGVHALYPSERLAVRGYWEVMRHYRGIVSIRDQLILRWQQDGHRPQVFIGVDAPDFNLSLALTLKRAGIPTFQYVCPAIWAWRPERIHLMKQALTHVWCLFPFEESLLRDQGMSASFVGHPLAQWIPESVDVAAARRKLALDPDRPVLALLPGSRKAEIDHLLAPFLLASRQLIQRNRQIQLVLPTLKSLLGPVKALIKKSGLGDRVMVLEGQSHDAMAAADVVMVASGTASLEAALFKKPMVIAYRMSWVSWQITRRKKRLTCVGLPNILCGEEVVPELIQDECTPEALAREVENLLLDRTAAIQIQERFASLHHLLRRPTHEWMMKDLTPYLSHAKTV